MFKPCIIIFVYIRLLNLIYKILLTIFILETNRRIKETKQTKSKQFNKSKESPDKNCKLSLVYLDRDFLI